MNGTVLLLAAGRGERLGSRPKAFERLAGTSLLRRSADAAAGSGLVEGLVVAVPAGMLEDAAAVLAGVCKPWRIVAGGLTRQDSSLAALEAAGAAEAVVLHDAARALCPPALFDACLEALDTAEAVCVGLPVVDTVKQVRDGVVVGTPDRASLVRVQTPQAFLSGVYRRAHEAARRRQIVATDDAALVEAIGVEVRVLPGDEENIKVTTPADLDLARAILARR